MRGRLVVVTAAALTVLSGVTVLLVATTFQQWHAVHEPGPASLDEALGLVAGVVAIALGTWLGISTVAALLAHLPGRAGALAERAARAWAPAITRRLAAVLVGAAVGGALAPGTALGDGPHVPTPGFTVTDRGSIVADPSTIGAVPGPGFIATAAAPGGDRVLLDEPLPEPGWTAQRPLQRPQASPVLVSAAATHAGPTDIVVHRGDTLWEIVRRHLGPGASDAEVAIEWPRWYRANRAVIGPDPDLILPGQIVRAPGDTAQARR